MRITILYTAIQILILHASLGQELPFGYYLDGKKKVKLPFVILDHQIVIKAQINGSEPLNFIFDTGVQDILLFDKYLLPKLGLEIEREHIITGIGNEGNLKAYITSPGTLEIKKIKNHHQRCIVMDTMFFDPTRRLGARIDGIIGSILLTNFIVKVDYGFRKITFYQKAPPEMKKYHSIPLTSIRSKPYVEIDVSIGSDKSRKGQFLIDTGSSLPLIISTLNPDLKLPDNKVIANLGLGLAGEMRGFFGRTETLSFGEVHFEEVLTAFPIASDYVVTFNHFGRLGSVGGELLSQMTMIFDYQSEAFYFKVNSNKGTPFEYDMSGIELYSQEETGSVMVKTVRVNSPAHKAGIRPNDEVISLWIEGERIPKLNIGALRHYLRSGAGRNVVVKTKRGKKTILAAFRLKRII